MARFCGVQHIFEPGYTYALGACLHHRVHNYLRCTSQYKLLLLFANITSLHCTGRIRKAGGTRAAAPLTGKQFSPISERGAHSVLQIRKNDCKV